jgi:hypothetical protein
MSTARIGVSSMVTAGPAATGVAVATATGTLGSREGAGGAVSLAASGSDVASSSPSN